MDDPRPDLLEDAAAWRALLRLARGQSRGCEGALRGFRAMGAELYLSGGRWRLRPRAGTEADYATVREYAAAEVDAITGLLARLPASDAALDATAL